MLANSRDDVKLKFNDVFLSSLVKENNWYILSAGEFGSLVYQSRSEFRVWDNRLSLEIRAPWRLRELWGEEIEVAVFIVRLPLMNLTSFLCKN